MADYAKATQKGNTEEPAMLQLALARCSELQKRGQVQLELAMTKSSAFVRQPEFKTFAVATTGGVVVMAPVGGAFGMCSGIVLGSMAGVVPALFTFGTSIPLGAAAGGVAGAAAGSVVGAIGGGAAGGGMYAYRVEIKNGVIYVKQGVHQAAITSFNFSKSKADLAINFTKDTTGKAVATVKAKGQEVVVFTQTRGNQIKQFTASKASNARQFAQSKHGKVTLGSAAAGAVAGSTTGGAVGLVAGAAIGVIPAFFTFGLSIPVSAAVGLCVGASSGGAIGTLGGGAAGYGTYAYREEIKGGANQTWTTVKESTSQAKRNSYECINHIGDKVRTIAGTGSTIDK